MKKRFAVVGAFAVASLISGYTVMASTTNAHTGLTKSDMKIGRLYIGETLRDVQKAYGTPNTKTFVHGNGAPRWEYTTLGFAVNGNRVWQIDVTKSKVGSTPQGIHVGSTEKALRRAYPHLRTTLPNQWFEEVDHKYAMDVHIAKGLVKTITITDLNP